MDIQPGQTYQRDGDMVEVLEVFHLVIVVVSVNSERPGGYYGGRIARFNREAFECNWERVYADVATSATSA